VVFGACGTILVLLSVLYMTASVFLVLVATCFGCCHVVSRADFFGAVFYGVGLGFSDMSVTFVLFS